MALIAAKHDLTFPLLADAHHAVAEKYGLWQKKSPYGRQFMGIARCSTRWCRLRSKRHP
jgi:peroxiredoxin Q/BCP